MRLPLQTTLITGRNPNLGPCSSSSARFAVNRPVVDLWCRSSRDSERVSQLLLGSCVQVLQLQDNWVHVESEDTYRGWMERRFLSPFAGFDMRIEVPFATLRLLDSDIGVRLPMGARLKAVREPMPGTLWGELPDGSRVQCAAGESAPFVRAKSPDVEATARLALQFLGTPYLWGGGSAFGFDCSGLVQFCYGMQGVVLRRDADIQRSDHRFVEVAFEELQSGDLVFFGSTEKITHVGMDLGNGSFVHSAGGTGVIVTEWGDDVFSPLFVDARRMMLERAFEAPRRHEAQNR